MHPCAPQPLCGVEVLKGYVAMTSNYKDYMILVSRG